MPRRAAVLLLLVLGVAACASDVGSTVPSASGSASGSPTSSGLRIVVVYRPVCGPEPVGTPTSRTACPEEPIGGIEVVATRGDGSEAARGTTDASGRVLLDVGPGTYTLTSSPAARPRIPPAPTAVTVGTEPAPTVTLVYESSMQ